MTSVRFILSIVLLLMAAYLVVMNWGCVIVSWWKKNRGIYWHSSMVPFVSFILAMLAYLICPRTDKLWLLSLPLLDIANWNLLWLPVVLIREVRKR